MSNSAFWQVQDAKARFSEFLETALKEGPQTVTRRGMEVAVLVPIDEWRGMKAAAKRGLKEILLNGPVCDDLVPERRPWGERPSVEFD